jgi:apolipoprotein N-acyltransferase
MRLGLVLLGALALSASAPPGWFPGAELLVFVGLAALYALCDPGCVRPRLSAYLVGLCYVLAFSWSLRHVLFVGYLGVGLVGGLYYTWTVAWTRALMRLAAWIPGPLAFGCAVAASSWLRAEMPELGYPHGQPIHALYRWPALLGPVALGGEALGNLLLGALAAAVVDLWRAWRVARPEWRSARRVLLAVALGHGACDLAYLTLLAPVPGSETLRVAAIEPGFESRFRRQDRWWVDRLLRPTLRVAGEQVADPPRLVLWPESCFPFKLNESPEGVSLDGPGQVGLAPGAVLLAGTEILRGEESWRAICLLLGADGRVLDWHEKEHPVPAGERVPFLDWLPAGLRHGAARDDPGDDGGQAGPRSGAAEATFRGGRRARGEARAGGDAVLRQRLPEPGAASRRRGGPPARRAQQRELVPRRGRARPAAGHERHALPGDRLPARAVHDGRPYGRPRRPGPGRAAGRAGRLGKSRTGAAGGRAPRPWTPAAAGMAA